jgi:beta-mannosidase
LEQKAYLSGLVQAYSVEIAIKYQRTAKPLSYGSLYWSFNDPRPAISWASIDYFGRWKPLQFMAKRLYPNVAIFCTERRVMLVNDNLYPIGVLAVVKVQNFNGTT